MPIIFILCLFFESQFPMIGFHHFILYHLGILSKVLYTLSILYFFVCPLCFIHITYPYQSSLSCTPHVIPLMPNFSFHSFVLHCLYTMIVHMKHTMSTSFLVFTYPQHSDLCIFLTIQCLGLITILHHSSYTCITQPLFHFQRGREAFFSTAYEMQFNREKKIG